MKLTKITGLIIFIAGIHLAGCDSESWNWFYWSKIASIVLMGAAVLVGRMIKQEG